MRCKCGCLEVFLAIVILVFSFLMLNLSWLTSKWIIVAAAIILLLHGIGHNCHKGARVMKAPARKARKVKRAAKRRKR